MAKIKNVSGEDRKIGSPGGPLVLAGAVYEVPDEDVYMFTCQVIWEAVDGAAEKAHAAGEAAYHERLREAGQPVPGEEPQAPSASTEGDLPGVDVDALKGKALADTLAQYELATTGTADEKRARIKEFFVEQAEAALKAEVESLDEADREDQDQDLDPDVGVAGDDNTELEEN